MRYLTAAEIKTWFAGLTKRPVAAVIADEYETLGDSLALMPNGTLFGGINCASTLDDLEQAVEMLRALAPKSATSANQPAVEALRAVLLRVQKHRYHEPNSDFMEYCAGCGRSPYNVPQHDDDCLVPAISRALRASDPEARS